ncbi:uncharacterized protein METZ01_LOCUS64177, partial [marine metagenome]
VDANGSIDLKYNFLAINSSIFRE